MQTNQYEWSVEVNGRPISEYGHEGRTYVAGRKGSNFTLKFKNNSASRVLVVPSVDSLSVMDGSAATADSGGYVVAPYSKLEIKGWRTSLNEAAKFIFSEKEKSYSVGTGNGESNCGVIGCRVFAEKVIPYIAMYNNNILGSPWTKSPGFQDTTYGTSYSPGMSQNLHQGHGMVKMMCCNFVGQSADKDDTCLSAFNLGAGYGEKTEDRVTTATFERGILEAELTLYYSDREGLKAMGVDLDKKVRAMLPTAFSDFCKPPTFK